MAAECECEPAQVALAWVLGADENVYVIPGTTKIAHLVNNMESRKLSLTVPQRRRLAATFTTEAVHGGRYPAE